MSHRSKYHNILIRNTCNHKCFGKYHLNGPPTLSACDRGGCGYSDPLDLDHDVLQQEPVKLTELPLVLNKLKGKAVWLFCLDLFDIANKDIIAALPEQTDTNLTVEGCVASFWKNYYTNIELLKKKNICEIWFGVESANKELRVSYNKPFFTNCQLIEICKKLRTNDIKYYFYLVHGPEDTPKTFLETNELIRECSPVLTWYSQLNTTESQQI